MYNRVEVTAQGGEAFGRLCASVWERHGIRIDIRTDSLQGCGIANTFMRGSGTWTVYETHAKRLLKVYPLKLFEKNKCQTIKWQGKIPDQEGLTKTGMLNCKICIRS